MSHAIDLSKPMTFHRWSKNENAAMQSKCRRSTLQAGYLVSIHTVVLRSQNNALICKRGNSKGADLRDPP
ncbi:MAG: hypothetical protein FRX49_01541 [Trebouxia sp. A1-2]|nr:MAG: hypothetical protein FRX49_01541 [Trebouxia sp. A1-2]